jgi:hypothetical protein
MIPSNCRWIAVLAALLLGTGCVPTDPVRTVHSANGKFMVKARTRRAQAWVVAVNDPGRELWTIPNVGAEHLIVSDDGENVALLRQSHGEPASGDHIALRLWNRQQGEVRAYKLQDLCDDFSTVGNRPLGNLGVVQWYGSDAMQEDTLVVTTADNFELRISLQNGAILSRERVLSFNEKCLIALGVAFVVLGILAGGILVTGVLLARKFRSA